MLDLIAALVEGVRPWLPILGSAGVVLLVLAAPVPGRGPRLFQRRDPWRGYRFALRRAVLERAGGRCEAPLFLAWGRCRADATEIDHIYPWSRGGPTILSNGQALCKNHNRRKSNLRPPWWYVLNLERRRSRYAPPDTDIRIYARMTTEEAALRRAVD